MTIEHPRIKGTSAFHSPCSPAVAAPMFLISGPELVIECCKNGIVGTFPALNQRTSEGFEEWLIEIKSELDKFEKEIKVASRNQNSTLMKLNIS